MLLGLTLILTEFARRLVIIVKLGINLMDYAYHATKDTVLLTENVLLMQLKDHLISDARLGIGTTESVLNALLDML